MPIYEYHCAKCNKDYELFVRPSEPLGGCPYCGEKSKKRIPSAPARGRNEKGGRGRHSSEGGLVVVVDLTQLSSIMNS